MYIYVEYKYYTYINGTEDIIYILSHFANYYIGLSVGQLDSILRLRDRPGWWRQGDEVNQYTAI